MTGVQWLSWVKAPFLQPVYESGAASFLAWLGSQESDVQVTLA